MISTESNNDSSTIISTVNNSLTNTNNNNNNNNYVTELISNSLNNRIIPKIGSLAKRFSLNYSGEGLVTDRERVRVVRVGIRFQVQVDSFLNRGTAERPRAILRAASTPEILDRADSRVESDTRPFVHSSPALNNSSASFLDRIHALNARNSQLRRGSDSFFGGQDASSYRHTDQQGLSTLHPHQRASMEDSSSYQVLRHFPGSNVTSFRELNWETAAFEQQVHEWVQWFGDKASNSRLPPFVRGVLNSAKSYANDNPLTAITLLTLLTSCALPIVFFLAFAMGTILFTFLGFLFVEGTVLTVASVILGGVLLAVTLGTLSILLAGVFAYFCTTQVFSMVSGPARPDAVWSFLKQIPVIGAILCQDIDTQDVPQKSNGIVHKYGSLGSNGHVEEDSDDEAHDADSYEIDEDYDDIYNEKNKSCRNGDAPTENILPHTD